MLFWLRSLGRLTTSPHLFGSPNLNSVRSDRYEARGVVCQKKKVFSQALLLEKSHRHPRPLELQTLSQSSSVLARSASFVFGLFFHGALPGSTRIDFDVEADIRQSKAVVPRFSLLDLNSWRTPMPSSVHVRRHRGRISFPA